MTKWKIHREIQKSRECRRGALNIDWGDQEGSLEEVILGRLEGAIQGTTKEGRCGWVMRA